MFKILCLENIKCYGQVTKHPGALRYVYFEHINEYEDFVFDKISQVNEFINTWKEWIKQT